MIRLKALLGAALAAAVVGAFCCPAGAQPAKGGLGNTPLTPRQLSRGLLWHGFENSGAEGARVTEVAYGALYADLDYPGRIVGGGNDWAEHFGSGPAWTEWWDIITHNGRGHGWWVAAKVDGKSVVSYSDALIKGKEESDDVVAIAVDPTRDFGGRFARAGYNTLNPRSGRPMANWWPGTTITSDAVEPREILNYRIGQYTDAATDNFPEDIILIKWTTGLGITGEKAAYGWGHPEYDDFIIVEWTFENTGDTNGDRRPDIAGGGHNLKNVYFAFHHRLMTSAPGVFRGSYVAYFWDWGPLEGCSSIFGQNKDNGQDDKIKYTEAPNYDGPADAKGLKLVYTYDWDNWCYTGQFADDVGDPWTPANRGHNTPPLLAKEGDLLSPAWVGFAEIDVDPTDGFAGDNGVYKAPKVAKQPFAHNLFHFQFRQESIAVLANLRTDEPDPTKMSDDTLYQMLTRSPGPSYFEPLNSQSAAVARPTRGTGDPSKGVPLLPLSDNPTEPMPYMPNPEWEWKGLPGIAAAYTPMQTYGPYDLAPGDKVKLVFAYVAGAPVEEGIKGWAKKKNNSDLRKEESGPAWANLVKHLKKAREAYALGYDLPNQPPDPDVTLKSSVNANVTPTWKDTPDKSINPDTGKPDVGGYKVYRSGTMPDVWELAGDVKVGDAKYYNASTGTYSFEDPNTLAGFRYYYNVRSYQGSANTGFVSRVTGRKVEGSVSAYPSAVGDPSTFYYPPKGLSPFNPVLVASDKTDRLEQKIRVVPNPYIIDDVHTYEGTRNVRIINIPRKCIIRVYNAAGDMVAEEFHDSADTGEFSYSQYSRTFTNQLKFGIYYVTVESRMPESMGKVQRTHFVVIR